MYCTRTTGTHSDGVPAVSNGEVPATFSLDEHLVHQWLHTRVVQVDLRVGGGGGGGGGRVAAGNLTLLIQHQFTAHTWLIASLVPRPPFAAFIATVVKNVVLSTAKLQKKL